MVSANPQHNDESETLFAKVEGGCVMGKLNESTISHLLAVQKHNTYDLDLEEDYADDPVKA